MGNRTKKHVVIAVLALFMIVSSSTIAMAEKDFNQPSYPSMVADLLVIRPLSLVSTAFGSVIFLGSLPFNMHSKERCEKAEKILIKEPAAYTFKRPLGSFK
ncbi:MAG: hypothetical protein U9P10_11040 [Thermodesulfobacteriota bacterium]|nr:hypothetical protein [Thermodesulfobacteriota bacterium]